MSNPTELPDLDRIEKEARSILRSLEKDYKGCVRESVRDILEIVAAARRAQPEGEAPQAATMKICRASDGCADIWKCSSALTGDCGAKNQAAQPAESGAPEAPKGGA
jgi:hypothetical protein